MAKKEDVSLDNVNDVFFESSYQDVWRKLIPEGLTEAECDFIQDVAGLSKGDKVLDLMCGYGRHSIQLARRGQIVTAVDNLKSYTQELAAAADHQSLPIQVLNEKALQADYQTGYAAAICMGNSFNFFNQDDACEFVKKVSMALSPNGFFIINTWMIAEIVFKYFREKDWHYAGEYKCILDYTINFLPTRIESKQTVISPTGKQETLDGIDYIYSLDQLSDMLSKADMVITGLFSTPRKRNFNLGDTRIYIVAQKLV